MAQNGYQMAREFHQTFDPRIPETPTAFTPEDTSFRAGFKAEELVEFLYAANGENQEQFENSVMLLHDAIDAAKIKVLQKNEPPGDPLVGQVDALTDLLYFTYGSFALINVDPTKILEIVHQANMHKLFPDGKPHYDPITNKVLKPADWQEKYAPEPLIKTELEKQKDPDAV